MERLSVNLISNRLSCTLPSVSMGYFTKEELAQIKSVPIHVSIVMDGNRRWARKRGVATSGHGEGAESVDRIVDAAAELGIKELTLYAFSTENWKRPRAEIQIFYKLLEQYLKKKCVKMVQHGICFGTIGQTSAFPKRIQERIESVKRATCAGKRMCLTLALNYGGRDEICRACNALAKKMMQGELHEITEEVSRAILIRHILHHSTCLSAPGVRCASVIFCFGS